MYSKYPRRKVQTYLKIGSKQKTAARNPLTDLSKVFIADEPPPEPPDLWDPEPRKNYTIYPRSEWDAVPPLEGIEDMQPPFTKVVFTVEYHGYTPACKSKEDCVKSLRLLQSLYMNQKTLPDIPYNFILTGDGNFYEGRGWNKKPQKSLMYEEYKDNTLDIAMITHYVNEPVNKRMKLENDLFDYMHQFVLDHMVKYISPEVMIDVFTGKRKY